MDPKKAEHIVRLIHYKKGLLIHRKLQLVLEKLVNNVNKQISVVNG